MKFKKKKKEFGWFSQLNPGNPEYNAKAFNHAMGTGEAPTEADMGCGESLGEATTNKQYVYEGPVYLFGDVYDNNFKALTWAVSFKQARNNIIYQAKEKFGFVRNAGGFSIDDKKLSELKEPPKVKDNNDGEQLSKSDDNGKSSKPDDGEQLSMFDENGLISTTKQESKEMKFKKNKVNEDLSNLNADYLDDHMKKYLPIGKILYDKETGEEVYVAKHFPDNGIGRYRHSVYVIPTKYKDLGKKAISQSMGLRYSAPQILSNLKEVPITEASNINRYSDVYDDDRKNQGWWYFTTHGVQPGSIPKGLNVLEVRDGENERGTVGTFVRLDGILNTSELKDFDMRELSPLDEDVDWNTYKRKDNGKGRFSHIMIPADKDFDEYTKEFVDDSSEYEIEESFKQLSESVEAPTFSAFITNLGKYNEGELVGKWVEFPIDEDDFEEELKEIGIGSTDEFGAPYEEWFVTDYDTNLPGFEWEQLGEYPGYDKLQEFGELIESIDDIEAVSNAMEVTGDLEEAINGLENGSIIFYKGFSSMSEFAEWFVDELGGVEEMGRDAIENYFDYEALGRELDFDTYEGTDPETGEERDDLSAGEYWCGDENASHSDIGYAYVDAVGFDGVGNIEYYFDYDSYGRDLEMDNFTLTSDGVIEYA